MSDLTKLLATLEDLSQVKTPIIISIEGPAASGKSTLAKNLEKLLPCYVFHMDDFFLPKELQNQARFLEIGGNIHYERFLSEVFEPLMLSKPFTYQVFDCHLQTYQKKFFDNKAKFIIIEGVYSYHPLFQKYYDFLIYCNIQKNLQLTRLKKRSTPEVYDKFLKLWLGLEDKYFNEVRPINYANYLIEAASSKKE